MAAAAEIFPPIDCARRSAAPYTGSTLSSSPARHPGVMRKILLMSILFAMITLPVLAARDGSGVRALKKTLFLVFLFNLFYMLGLLFVYEYVH
jgi:hypothetical protein